MHSTPDRRTRAAGLLARIAIATLLLSSWPCLAQPGTDLPVPIERLLDDDPLPQAVIGPNRRFVLLVHERQLLRLESLAEPAVDIAGRRINLRSGTAHAPLDYYGLSLIDLTTGSDRRIPLPRGAVIGYPSFAPDGSRFAFTVTRRTGAELWIGEPEEARARPLLNSVDASRGLPCVWTADSRRLLCRRRAEVRTDFVQRELDDLVHAGLGQPTVLSTGLARDLLESQLELVDSVSRQRYPIGQRAAIESAVPAPAGAFLLVTRIAEPYPRVSEVDTVQRVVEVWDRFGRVHARLPEAARAATWQAGKPATLAWVERAEGRDRIVYQRPPFTAPPREGFVLPHRFSGLRWLGGSGEALVSDYDASAGRTGLWRVPLGAADTAAWVTDYSNDSPRTPLMTTDRFGLRVVMEFAGGFYLRGREPNGGTNRGLLEHVALSGGKRRRVWTEPDDGHETLQGLLASDAGSLLTRYETSSTGPNYFVANERGRRPLTQYAHASQLLKNARRMRLEYLRDDGLELAASLYLPPGYKGLQRLPLIVWAYPRRVSAGGTTRIVPAPARFLSFERAFRLFFLLHGYAVLDDVSMPIVGDDRSANDTFIEQIIGNASAALDAAVATGFIAPDRLGVAGHSYGAFMVANLLAHSELFDAGVALSGAYNRTLTPFGFQTERRTLWEATETYLALSPLLYSHRIAAPVLLVHGLDDDNAGTSPLQSTEFHAAIRGNGGESELLLLPWEGHSYRARESVFKTAAGMLGWFDRHLNAGPGGFEREAGAMLRPQ